ncbi:hypothetical protein [uncultured Ligilactobacillus sp.]|uniref:hypothetical protein n=1 Tax=uncultured Ligilactobacillus sp. TaxID=2837633 RepID=UPI00272BCA76|nr:hypothetical protein [uncultured Ligilactobacillus sp.]
MQLVKDISVNDILEDGVVEGLRYIILKSEFSLNGYIERPDNLPEGVDNELYWSLDVHGRFSFSGYIRCNDSNFSGSYLGFDTVHDIDKIPGSATWTVKDVQLECIHVAEQLKELERKLE